MYANGRGVPQDYAAAMSWWRKAAKQGHAEAQNNLGSMYAKGQWLNLGAAGGDKVAAQRRKIAIRSPRG